MIMSKKETDTDVWRAHGLRRIPRRHRTQPGEVTLKACKAEVTIMLDADIVEHFKRKAAAPDAAPYQTQINNALRRVMEDETGTGHEHPLVNNEAFIASVAERVRAYVSKRNR